MFVPVCRWPFEGFQRQVCQVVFWVEGKTETGLKKLVVQLLSSGEIVACF